MKKILMFSILLFGSMNVNAAHVDCGYIDVGIFYVQSTRSDASSHANKLVIALGGGCPGYGYVSNEEKAYPSIMSMLLASKMSKEKIRIVVNDAEILSGAARIEFVNFK
jgi:hypothetical protein